MNAIQFLGNDLWERLAAEARQSSTRCAAVAYVTDVSQVPFKAGDVLVVNASEKTIAQGSTTVEVLRVLLDREVSVFSVADLHAKVYVFDHSAIVGSANLSSRSREYLKEAAVFTSDALVVSEARTFVDSQRKRGKRVDPELLNELARIPVQRAPSETWEDEPVNSSGDESHSLNARELFQPSITGNNKIRMASEGLVDLYCRTVHPVDSYHIRGPAYAANLIWTASGQQIETKINQLPYFTAPSQVLNRASKASSRALVEDTIRFIRVLSETREVSESIRYWAKEALSQIQLS